MQVKDLRQIMTGTIAKKIPVKQYGLATGQIIFVQRRHGKSNPLKIEVKYIPSD